MAVTLLGEDTEARYAQNTKGVRTYRRAFKLQSNDKTDGPYEVGSTSGLPLIGDVHHEDASAWCVSLTVENFAPYKGWRVTAEYSSEHEIDNTPTDDPALITWDSEQFQRPAIFDSSGNAIVNSAGDPFDPPLMMDDSRRVVTIIKNLSAVPSWILTYQDAVNNASFTLDGLTIGAGLAKIQRVAVSERQIRNGTTFRQVTLVMHLEKNGWLLEPLDAGFRENVSGSLQNIRNPGDDELPAAPVPLNGAGMALDNPSVTNNVFLSFTVYETKDFSVLPLT